MEDNSSYGLSGNATDIIMTSNPSYSVGAKSSIKEKSSDYVHTDMLWAIIVYVYTFIYAYVFTSICVSFLEYHPSNGDCISGYIRTNS